jgi:hypothetical protein
MIENQYFIVSEPKNDICTPTGDTYIDILITEVVTKESNPIIEVYNPHPLESKCKVTYKKETKVVCLPPKVIKTPKANLYMKVCGTYMPTDSKYVGCMRKVDRCYARALVSNGSVNQGDITVVKCKDA